MLVARAAFHHLTPRFVLGGLALSSLILGIGQLGQDFLPWRWAWAWVFFLAFGANALGAARFSSQRVLAVAGAATITANLMRGLVLPVGKLAGVASLDRFRLWDIVVSVTLWWTLAGVVAVLFFRRLEPLASAHRSGG